MSNEYYNSSVWPSTSAQASSSPGRSEVSAIATGFDKLPVLATHADELVFINATATALESLTVSAAQTVLGLVVGSDLQAYDAVLAALAGLTSAANKVPYLTGATTAGLLDFLDDDSQAADSATAIASQQSIKAYADAEFAGYSGALGAPSGTRTVFVNLEAALPAGWTSVSGLDGRMLFVHATNATDTFGTVQFDANITTSGESASHTHNWSLSGTLPATNDTQALNFQVGGGNYSSGTHTHTYSISTRASGARSADSTHTITAPKGTYALLGNKT